MKQLMNKIFLNDKFILYVILLNSCIIYMQVAGYQGAAITIIDVTCTCIFLIEMLASIYIWAYEVIGAKDGIGWTAF